MLIGGLRSFFSVFFSFKTEMKGLDALIKELYYIFMCPQISSLYGKIVFSTCRHMTCKIMSNFFAFHHDFVIGVLNERSQGLD